MKKQLLAAAAVLALSSPALARDNSGYVGIEGGALFPKDTKVRVGVGPDSERFQIKNKTGLDIDALAGYDFGPIRAEAELGWKRTKHKEYEARFVDDDGNDIDIDDADGNTRIVSLMGNVLADFGNEDGASFYAGGGAGWAWSKYKLKTEDPGTGARVKDDAFAWQLIAGVRYAVSPQVDVGLKYRYFQTKLNQDDLFDEDSDIRARGKFKSHSVLASLIFNFAPPAPPPAPAPAAYTPPPPPPAPATQTCSDGSVVLVTDVCPVPPPPAARSGERG